MASEVVWYRGAYVRYKNHKRRGPYLIKSKRQKKDAQGKATLRRRN